MAKLYKTYNVPATYRKKTDYIKTKLRVLYLPKDYILPMKHLPLIKFSNFDRK